MNLNLSDDPDREPEPMSEPVSETEPEPESEINHVTTVPVT